MYYILISAAAVILILLFVPVRIILEYDKSAHIYLKILFWKKLLNKESRKPHEKNEKQTAEKKDKTNAGNKIKKILSLEDDIKEFADFTAKRCVTFEKLRFSLDFGTGDAAATGILTGLVNGAVYTIISVIHHNTTLKSFDVNINPDFEGEKFVFYLLCIAKTRAVHIISMGLKGLKLYKKFKK
ncbi:MAG: DUF2953 domain-containing protein [Clostridia bacterium]|nr:DUF2953 domain-containing protein [Clostridia bacterium]